MARAFSKLGWITALICGLRDGSGFLEARVDHRVDLRIDSLDAINGVVDQLAGADLASPHEFGEPHRVNVGKLGANGGFSHGGNSTGVEGLARKLGGYERVS